jgi:NitT/TauT family transport system substrate-binding protein
MDSDNHQVDPRGDVLARAPRQWKRRKFVQGMGALLAAAGLAACEKRSATQGSPPETTSIRIVKTPGICIAPEYIAEDLLRAEGFSEVVYVPMSGLDSDPLAENRADISMASAPALLADWDAGKRVTALAGIHKGCYELFVNDRVPTIQDLVGKRVAIAAIGEGMDYFYLVSMLAFVGMDPRADISWVEGGSSVGAMKLFVEGKADAFLGLEPQSNQLRTGRVGHAIVNTALDDPWAQYFCCLVSARPEFVNENPVATKRALRAILKAADVCAHEAKHAARQVLARGYAPSFEVAVRAIKSVSYDRWHTDDVEDSLRFFGRHLHAARMIESNPLKLIAQGTDWSFLNELEREINA